MDSAKVISSGWIMDGRAGMGLIMLTLGFFIILSVLCSFLPMPEVIRKKSASDPFRVFRWRNLVISWIHASITGIWTVSCLIIYREDMWKDMLVFKNWPAFAVCCFSTGYFIYDTLDIVLARRMREKWEILVHHTAIVCSAMYTIWNVNCVGYHVLSMSIEFNTAFLHLRKLLQMAAVPRTNPFLQINRYLNLITFVLCRFGPMAILTRAIYLDGRRVPLWFAIQFSGSMLTLAAVNCILFCRLVKADLWPFNIKSSEEEAKALKRHKGLPLNYATLLLVKLVDM